MTTTSPPQQHPRFTDALTAVDAGDVAVLRRLLGEYPELVHARAMSDDPPYNGYFWRATLLHHTAGNPIRDPLPENAVEVAGVLLEAGAEADATCGGGPSQPESAGGTTLGLVASGAQAHQRGLTAGLLDALLEHDAQLDPAGTGGCMWIALYHTVEHQGQRDVAQMLYDRGHDVDMCFASGLGRLDLVRNYFEEDGSLAAGADRFYRHHRRAADSKSEDRDVIQDAFIFACITNQPEAAAFLLERGADINGVRPWGPERVTGLHGAAWAGWKSMAEFLFARGADLRVRDPRHQGTPVGWAAYCKRQAVLEFLLSDESKLDPLDAVELAKFKRTD